MMIHELIRIVRDAWRTSMCAWEDFDRRNSTNERLVARRYWRWCVDAIESYNAHGVRRDLTLARAALNELTEHEQKHRLATRSRAVIAAIQEHNRNQYEET